MLPFISHRHDHAGENMTTILDHRDEGKEAPIQMCDAVNRNFSPKYITLLALRIVHAHRNFVDDALSLPDLCSFVIGMLAKVYRLDGQSKKQRMDGDQRLWYHARALEPVMESLYGWLLSNLTIK